MSTTFNKSTFETTYKDDFDSADNFHRILFNSGRALQARELTQMQTIIQEEIARFGRNIFKEGAAVNPGGPSITSDYEFVKIASTNVPADTSTLLNAKLTQSGKIWQRLAAFLIVCSFWGSSFISFLENKVKN